MTRILPSSIFLFLYIGNFIIPRGFSQPPKDECYWRRKKAVQITTPLFTFFTRTKGFRFGSIAMSSRIWVKPVERGSETTYTSYSTYNKRRSLTYSDDRGWIITMQSHKRETKGHNISLLHCRWLHSTASQPITPCSTGHMKSLKIWIVWSGLIQFKWSDSCGVSVRAAVLSVWHLRGQPHAPSRCDNPVDDVAVDNQLSDRCHRHAINYIVQEQCGRWQMSAVAGTSGAVIQYFDKRFTLGFWEQV